MLLVSYKNMDKWVNFKNELGAKVLSINQAGNS